MSRPPGREYTPTRLSEQYYEKPIDFIGNQYDPVDCRNSYIMAQAGFPGYAQAGVQNGAQYAMPVNAGFTAPTYATVAAGFPYAQAQPNLAQNYAQGYSQGYVQPNIAAQVMTTQPVQQTIAAPYSTYPNRPLESEAAVNDRIKHNIDAIMESQKTAILNSKLENLTNKVQSLAQNIEHSESSHVRSLSEKVERLSRNISDGESSTHIKSLSEKVDRLSRSLEQSPRPAATETLSSSADSDIARRLRRLAAESSAKRDERIPDW